MVQRIFAALMITGVLTVVRVSTVALPEGDSGIAARYANDVGITSDPAVIFADDFESYADASGLSTRWSQLIHRENMRIATESGHFFSGTKALEFTVPITSSEVSNDAAKDISPAQDVLFLRYYAKYDANIKVPGSSHNGMIISAHYCCPGVPADGTNKFLVSFEAGKDLTTIDPGQLNAYVYHPAQRSIWGDHFFPTGIVLPNTSLRFDFGPEFTSRPDVIPALARWYCYEMMVKANTPGQKDGRIAFWLDGQLIADFPNMRLRDTTSLKIDRITIDLHMASNTAAVAKKWMDNVVVATSYIGPIASGRPPSPPTGIRVVR